MGIIEKQSIQDIANAIRNRNGLTTLYKPREMDEAILNLYSTTKVNNMLDYILPCYEKEATSYTIQYADADRPGSISKLEGNTTQNGTPTPTSPVEVKTVSGDNNIVVSNEQHVTGNSYRVDLGGKNIFNKENDLTSITTANNSGATTVKTTDKITVTTGSDANSGFYITRANFITYINNFSSTDTYYISMDIKASRNITVTMGCDTRPNFNITTNITRISIATKIASNGFVVYSQSQTANDTIEIKNIMISTSQDITYSPYVSNPIELCKIGNYVDELKRAEGKQLFDKDDVIANKRLDSSGNLYTENGYSTSDFIQIEPSTAYTLQRKTSGGSSCYVLYDSNKTFISRVMTQTQTSWTFTTTDSTRYIRIADYTNDLNIIMLNEGSTALPYEPYGNTWYIEKNIGKYIFNGTENWGNGQYGTNSYYTPSLTDMKLSVDGSPILVMTNLFKGVTYDSRTTGNNIVYSDRSLGLYVRNTSYTSFTDFKNLLSTENMTVYYVKATTSYEVITNTNLIEQLNNLQDIILQPSLCYIDWVGEESPTMKLFAYLDKDKIIEEITD